MEHTVYKFFGGERCVCVCVSVVSSFWRGTPGGPPLLILCVYIQEDRHLVSTWTSGSLRGRHTSWEGFCKCAHTLKTFQFCSTTPYITHPALFTTPLYLYDCQTSPPSPPRPPTLCSLYHPLTWLQTNEILSAAAVLYLVFVGFFFFLFPLWYDRLTLRNFLVHCVCVWTAI